MLSPVREISRMMDKKERVQSSASASRKYSEQNGTFQDSAQMLNQIRNLQALVSNLLNRVAELEARPPDAIFRSYRFDSLDEIAISHNLGCYPVVQVLGGVGYFGQRDYGDGVYGGTTERQLITPLTVTYDNENTVTVTLSAASSGEVLIIGR